MKAPYLCIPNRNKPLVDNRKRGGKGDQETGFWKPERSLKEWKQQRIKSSFYGKVMLAKEIDNMTSNFERNYDSQSIKHYLQWRV